MSEESHGHGHAAAHDHIHPEPTSFLKKYIFSEDHKIRWQLAFPFEPLPMKAWKVIYQPADEPGPDGKLGTADDVKASLHPGEDKKPGTDDDYFPMPAETYPVLVTMHGTIMIFFVIIPLLTGFFGNYVIPLQIGARDMAFPFLNMMSFWCAVPAGLLMAAAWFVKTGGPGAGWTSYPPLSALPMATESSKLGQTLWLIAVFLVGSSSIMGGINYMTTIINLRAPGMSLTRMPLSIWALFITSILQVLATPVLAASLVLLFFDKNLGTSFFLPAGVTVGGQAIPHAGGGHPLLFQHLFWFYSHPAVYILILPGMGLVSDILPTFCRKPIFGYKAMAYSMAGIAGLGFTVWAHHMFQAGMNPTLGTTFMLSTMVIAVPSSVKVFNWLGTLWGGSIRFKVPMLHSLAFISMFIIGGLSGVFLACTPVDVFLHDTYYVVAHFHYVVFGGSVFAVFGGIAFWWPKVTGRMMSETLGKIHFWLSFIAFNGVFFPMHILGMGGQMRRIANPLEYQHLHLQQNWNVYITYFAIMLGLTQILLVVNIVWSTFWGERASDNPWESTGLPWTISSPPPYYNYKTIPRVHHGPYEFSVPGVERDYVMQTDKPGLVPEHGH
jgi:cytochrome c oxidase subunit 1